MMNEHDILEPIMPGEILREDFSEPLGISINRLSRDLSVPLNRISEIVNGKRAIDSDCMREVSKGHSSQEAHCERSCGIIVARDKVKA